MAVTAFRKTYGVLGPDLESCRSLGAKMKVQFEFTAAELAEVTSRQQSRYRIVHRWRHRSAIAAGILLGALAFAMMPSDRPTRIVIAAVMALAVWGSVFLLSGQQRRMAILKLYRERLGGEGPFPCEVELTSPGVVSRQLGQETLHPWSQVVSVLSWRGESNSSSSLWGHYWSATEPLLMLRPGPNSCRWLEARSAHKHNLETLPDQRPSNHPGLASAQAPTRLRLRVYPNGISL